MFSWMTADPFLSLWTVSLGASAVTVGTIFSLFGLLRIFTGLPAARLADKIGRRKLIVIGLALNIPAYILAFAPRIDYLFAACVIFPIGFCIHTTVSMIYIADVAPVEKRAVYFGIFQGMSSLAAVIGPIIGGFIIEIYGLNALFYSSPLTVTVGTLLALKLKEPEKVIDIAGKERAHPSSFRSYARVLMERNPLIINVCACVAFALSNPIRVMFIPIFARQVLLLNSVEIGYIISILSLTSLVTLFGIRKLEAYFARITLFAIGLMLSSASMLSFALSSNFYTLVMSSVVCGIGQGITFPLKVALITDFTKQEHRGMAIGISNTMLDLSLMLGPMAMALLLGDIALGFYIAALATGVSCIPIFLLRNQKQQK